MPDFFRLVHCRIWAFLSQDEGQAVTEYALVIALIALVSIVALQLLGGGVRRVYTSAASGI